MCARQIFALLSLVALWGCGGAECDTVWFADFDGDDYGDRDRKRTACEAPPSFVSNALDCDDATFERNPAQTEIACDGIDNDCDEVVDNIPGGLWFLDRDGDGFGDSETPFESCEEIPGYTKVEGDCDDGDAARYPGNIEICDGIDNDCNGSVDEAVPYDLTWYRDADGDGFGDDAVRLNQCVMPSGYVASNTDCDDTDWTIHPLAAELCDGVDNDCDLLVDDDDPDPVVGGMIVYLDFDLDGFGQALALGEACTVQPGWSDNDDDCVDTDWTINPDATEVCGGGDENCNGLIDDSDPTLDVSTQEERWLDFDGDGLGDAALSAMSCDFQPGWVLNDFDCDDNDPAVLDQGNWAIDGDGDGATSGLVVAGWECEWPGRGYAEKSEVGDCDDRDPNRFPGNTEICGDAKDQDCSGLDTVCPIDLTNVDIGLDLAHWRIDGETEAEEFGSAMAIVGDIDGDGLDDLVAGAPMATGIDVENGFARLFIDSPREDGGPLFASSEFVGSGVGDRVGTAVHGGEDLTGNGSGDLVLGSPYPNAGGVSRGAVWIMEGPASTSQAVSNSICRLYGSGDNDAVGASVLSAGDVVGSASPDLVVGAPGYDGNLLTNAGGVFLVEGGALNGNQIIDSIDLATITGSANFDGLGASLARVDYDQDGFADFLVGAPLRNGLNTDAGTAYLFEAGLSGIVDAFGASRHEFNGVDAYEFAGTSFGTSDEAPGALIIGGPGGGAGGEGVAYYVETAGLPHTVDLGTSLATFTGEQPGDLAGTSVALVDLDDDATPDVVIGAPAAAGTGAVYIFYGPVVGAFGLGDAPTRLFGEQPGDLAGTALASGGDLFGTGVKSLLIGAPGVDTEKVDAGAIYIFTGGF